MPTYVMEMENKPLWVKQIYENDHENLLSLIGFDPKGGRGLVSGQAELSRSARAKKRNLKLNAEVKPDEKSHSTNIR